MNLNLNFALWKNSLPGANNDKVVLCVDISGSTSNCTPFHQTSRNIYNNIKDYPHIIIGWDHDFRILSDLEYLEIVTGKRGFGSTQTSAIANGLQTLPPGNLHIIILTDGGVDITDIKLCDSVMSKVTARHKILSVTAYISSIGPVNCSVLAPFLRGEWSSLVLHDRQNNTELTKVHSINTKERSELLGLVKTATTEEQINAIYDQFVTLLTAMTMGKSSGDPEMRA